MADGLRLLTTGFGPFPGAPENPTEALMRSLADEFAAAFGAGAFEAIVLPTEYRRSWEVLERVYAGFLPDIVIHFGLSGRAETLRIETTARNRLDVARPDGAGTAPAETRLLDDVSEALSSTAPTDAISEALEREGIPAALSNDAGAYVCNATFYRSLAATPPIRNVGFIHVPPARFLPTAELKRAAQVILRTAAGL